MRKVDCAVNLVKLPFNARTGIVCKAVREGCGVEQFYTDMDLEAAQHIHNLTIPECKCQPIPDDVEMSIC